jgi:DNA-binding GntR family transcriptional regulator
MTDAEPVVIPIAELLPDRSGPVPLYFQLASGLERAILSNSLPPGSRLENELSLSERLGLSRPTVRRAIQELVEKGLLVRRRGIGTQVVHGAVSRRIELTSLYDDLERTGKTPSTKVLEATEIPAEPRIAEHLGVPVSTPVLRLRRLRLSDDVPISVLENYLPPTFADVRAEDLGTLGLYAVLRARGVTMRVARQNIGARKATPAESRLPGLDRGAPVLTMDRTAYDAAGVAIEFGHHCYRPDLYSFEMTLVER